MTLEKLAQKPWTPLVETLQSAGVQNLQERLFDGASEKQIAELEAELGFGVPDDLRLALIQHNGFAEELLPTTWILTVDEIVSVYQEVLACLGPLDITEVGTKFVPFAWNEQPPYFCVDASEEDNGRVFMIDEGEIEVLAPSLREWIAQQAASLANEKQFCFSKQGAHYTEGRRIARIDSWDGNTGECRGELGPSADLRSDFAIFEGGYVPQVGDIVDCTLCELEGDTTVANARLIEPADIRLESLRRELHLWQLAGFSVSSVTTDELWTIPFREEWNPTEAASVILASSAPVFNQKWVPVLAQKTLENFNRWSARWDAGPFNVNLEPLIAEARKAADRKKSSSAAFMANRVFASANDALIKKKDQRLFARIENKGHPLEGAWILAEAEQATALRDHVGLSLVPPKKPKRFRFWK